jgi:WhiB family redox-sensing transcriptional regulator
MIARSHTTLARSVEGRAQIAVHVPAWYDQALCAEVDGEMWYPDAGGTIAPAKRVCRRCPVQAECLTHALETNEKFGIWGGLSTPERQSLKKRSVA